MKRAGFNLERFGRRAPAALVVIGLLIFLFCFRAVAEETAITNSSSLIQLRPAIQVDSEGVFLDQVVGSEAGLPRVRLCDSPACGKSLVLARADVARLSRDAAYDSSLTNWTGPEAIRVTRRMRALSEKEALNLLTSFLQHHYVKEQGELELRLARPWTLINVPDEEFTIKVVDLPTTGVSASFIARFELETLTGEKAGAWQVPLQAKIWREVWVARSPIKRGDSVRGADLTRERRDMLFCHEALAELATEDSALEFVEPVQPGVPLLARFLRLKAIVHRGQSLMAMVQDGALVITLKVEALEDGAAGQVIRVRNPLSRRDLHGRVLDEKNLLVSL